MQKSPKIITILGTLYMFLIPIFSIGQSDTVNQIDETGQRQGYWIVYQNSGGEAKNLKIEEGYYLDDRKDGVWIKYYDDGVTPRIKGTYVNNRPKGDFERYHPNGQVSEKGNFYKNAFVGDYWLFYPNGKMKHHNPCGKSNHCDSVYYYSDNGCLTHIDFAVNGSPNIKRSLVFSKTNCNQLLDTVINYDAWASTYQWESDTINQIQAVRLTYPLDQDQVKSVLENAEGNYLDENTVNFWQVVAAEKNVLPILFDLMTDTESTNVVNKCGTRNLTVGELAYFAAIEIVDVEDFKKELDGQNIFNQCGGITSYWRDSENNQYMRDKFVEFYEDNQANLTFVPLYNSHKATAFKKKYGVKGRYVLSVH